MSNPIHFLKVKDPYGCFSNFSPHPITLWGYRWVNTEAAYQATKFFPSNSEAFKAIWEATSPWTAARIGRTSPHMVPFWESAERSHLERILGSDSNLIGIEIDDGRGASPAIELYKDAVMFKCLKLKASEHRFIRQTLLDTGDRTLTEAFDKDSYWAWGANRKGLGKLGKLWMLLRNELRKAEALEPKDLTASEVSKILEDAED